MLILKLPTLCRRLLSFSRPKGLHFGSKHVRNEHNFVKYYVRRSRQSTLFSSVIINQVPACCVYHPYSFKRNKYDSSNQEKVKDEVADSPDEPPEKLSLFQRYKKMLKEYWYVLIPVHLFTSACWFGGFYYAAKSGIDIIPFLEYINIPEKLLAPLRNSSLGHIAVASAFYKLATPARYMVTLGGTTFAVKFLTKRGLIRPVPTKAEFKTMLQNKLKKDSVHDK